MIPQGLFNYCLARRDKRRAGRYIFKVHFTPSIVTDYYIKSTLFNEYVLHETKLGFDCVVDLASILSIH